MTPLRYRDEDSLSRSFALILGGALAGFAVGALVAHRFGGLAGIIERFRGETDDDTDDWRRESDYGEEEYEDEIEEDFAEIGIGAAEAGSGPREDRRAVATAAEELEQRVLEAFRNDPVLAGRSVDISGISEGIVELTGWVDSEAEAEHAVTLARGVPSVDTVVNRLAVRPREERLDNHAERYASGDPSLTERRWEGRTIGTGRRRQGNSSEPDRHADPRPQLEERWTSEDVAIAEAAEDVVEKGRLKSRRPERAKGTARADGSPVAPSGVPKADHVSEPSVTPTPPTKAPRAD